MVYHLISRLSQFRRPITKTNQSDCSIAGPIILSIGPGSVPNDPARSLLKIFGEFRLCYVITLLLIKLARDHTRRISPSACFVRTSLRPIRTVKTTGQYSPSTALTLGMYCLLTQAEQKTRSSSKIQSLFDADDDDEGMFGGTADDIFAASPSQVYKKGNN